MPDREFDESTTVRLTESQKEDVEMLADEMETSESEVWRRLLFMGKVLFSDQVTLADALRPIPNIVEQVDEKHPGAEGGTASATLQNGSPTLVCEDCGYEVPTTGQPLEEAVEEYNRHECDAATIKT